MNRFVLIHHQLSEDARSCLRAVCCGTSLREMVWLILVARSATRHPACSHPASDRVNCGAGWAPSFRLAPSSFESLAWLWALFGPGHACKGSRSELLQQKRARTIAWLARGERWVTDAGRNPKALGPVARYDSCPTVAYGISRRPVSKRFCSTSASNGEPTNRTKSPSITA